MRRRVGVHDIKQALLDQRFRDILPEEVQEDVQKFLKNPGCACNHPIYVKIMRLATKAISEYFPSREPPDLEEMDKQFEALSKNNWQVINCHIDELTEKLRDLGVGRKQIEIARWEDQVTVVINHLETF